MGTLVLQKTVAWTLTISQTFKNQKTGIRIGVSFLGCSWTVDEIHDRVRAVGWLGVEILHFKMSHSAQFSHWQVSKNEPSSVSLICVATNSAFIKHPLYFPSFNLTLEIHWLQNYLFNFHLLVLFKLQKLLHFCTTLKICTSRSITNWWAALLK